MSWLAVTLTVDATYVETLSDALLEAGAISVDVADALAGTADEHALFGEPGEPATGEWAKSRLNALFNETNDVATRVSAALQAVNLDPATSVTISPVADQDWVRATQSQFQPVRVSSRLWVVPTWHTPPDPQAINLVIDPGLAFGTGTHPTTRLCLAWLDANVSGGESVLDYGSGSGILGIAALKLGAKRATGVDIDPLALLAARHNAMQNQVEMNFIAAESAAPTSADIVVANILANPLKLLAPLLTRMTSAGGRILLSGVLDQQATEVADAYRGAFELGPLQHEDGWVLINGRKLAR
ncbi:MAG: Ribosomal protein methyltransferase [Betaproteobacteria bacterium]|nr:Ribosomal protein methyltransferase [Betaproteobacteria bacterium]